MRILVIGGSFGGLTVAFSLRQKLGARHEIVLVSKEARFTFIPSLPWVAMGWRRMADISFDLAPVLSRWKVGFVEAAVIRIDPAKKQVHTAVETLDYDYLVIATGHRSANEAVPGLGPFDGPGHSLMSPPEAEEAREAWTAFLDSPGPMVIGCAPGASCIGPAYEFAFEVHHALARRGLRHKVPIVFVTPEPHLGHFGVGGFGKARQFLEGEFEARDIRYRTSAAIASISAEAVQLVDGPSLPSRYSMILPALSGVRAVAESGLGNPKGFIPVDAHYRHKDHPAIYAVGVAVALPPVEETPVPVNFPKTSNMTRQMAAVAAHNLAADILGGAPVTRTLSAECILDMGDRGAHMFADPIRPPRNRSEMSIGRRWLWAKRAYERYCLWRLKRGWAGPASGLLG
ncbi:MAG: FAD-dependent oxidoreductase [Rhodospirillales bacterium]|nr:FAD-dependent oxidoreductase [Rhodospirillales bacterium]